MIGTRPLMRMDSTARHGAPAEVDRAVVGVGAQLTDEVVRHTLALPCGDLVGDDVEAFMDLDLVGVDDLFTEAQREVDGQHGLAGGCGAHDQHHLSLAATARHRKANTLHASAAQATLY